MAHLHGEERANYVQDMFGRIAGRYNLMNTLMTGGQDRRWRRFTVQQANLQPDDKLLDLATGTGDIALEAQKMVDDLQVVGADFSLPMMVVGRQRSGSDGMTWAAADALHLPFRDNTFDAVTSGYLVRNVIDIPRAFAEQLRVLKPGGRIVILDSTPPPNNLLRPLIMIHLKYVVPMMGRLISGKNGADAYRYLPESTQKFKTADELAAMMRDAGIRDVSFSRLMFGTMAVHWGIK